MTKDLHALKNNATQVPLETTIEVVLIPQDVHSTLSGNNQLSAKWWTSEIENCM